MIVDSHCHLADAAFADDLADVVARARQAGVETALCILSADEPDEVDRALVVRQAWPSILFAAAIHPHRAGAYAGRADQAAAVTRQAAARVAAVVIGEIGLDYHYEFAPRDVQREVFAAQVALSVELDRPVAIHTRLAADDTLAVLQQAGAGRVRGVIHCFSGTMEEARRALDLGLLISLSGMVTFPKSGAVRDVARFVPDDRLLVETDAPFLAPVPHRGKRNEPAWIAHTLQSVAAVRQTAPDHLARQISANFAAFVGRRERAA